MMDNWTLSGEIVADKPKTSPIFAITLPKILPKAMSLFPLKEAIMLTAPSGAELPKATMVTLIIIGRIYKELANLDDPLTNHFDPKCRVVKPIKNMKTCINIGDL
jgi:hypothetical protein